LKHQSQKDDPLFPG